MRLRKNRKIVFLTPYPYNSAPGQRFRFEQYLEILIKNDFSWAAYSFLSAKENAVLYTNGHTIIKVAAVIKGFIRRAIHIAKLSSADFVFIFREASPIGPPFIEWAISKVFRKKIIYDFDDAIWLTDQQTESRIFKEIKWRSKISSICRWSHKISCGNRFLLKFAQQYNRGVIFNPTTIDLDGVKNKIRYSYEKREQKKVVIGWTGSHSTLKYLKILEPLFQKLENQFDDVSFLIIADQKSNLKLNRLHQVKWNEETEIQDLEKITIGVMPLPDDEWSKGKCGFKILQYMALGIPCVASSVGANKEIIENGINGYLCSTENEWSAAIEKLISSPEHRIQIGQNGKTTVIQHYSVDSNTDNFLGLFE